MTFQINASDFSIGEASLRYIALGNRNTINYQSSGTRYYVNSFGDGEAFNELSLEEVKDLIMHNIKSSSTKAAIRNSIRAVLY